MNGSEMPFSLESLAVLKCMFLLSEDGRGVDVIESRALLREQFGLTEEEATRWFAIARAEGALE